MKIKIDLKLFNWNDTIKHCRYNKYSANNIKKKEMEAIGYYLRGIEPIKEYPIKINCEWHIKNVNSDLDNKSIKAVLDQMQQMNILENDNIKHISEINYKAIKDTSDYLILEIIENN